MAIPYNIYSPYERLIEMLGDAAAKSNTGFVRAMQSLSPCFQYTPAGIAFECYLILDDWSWRATSTKEAVTIVLRAQEEMTRNGEVLLRSTVSLSYFVVQDGNGTLLHTVHFDYGPDLVCHPTFHAQVTDEPVIPQGDETHDLKLEFELTTPELRCFRNSRIPTSDMTLSSVLFCLAADHIGESFFKDFKPQFQKIQDALPKPTFEPLKRSLQSALGHFRSSHWFAHMP